jgi:type IV pilus assembly protein PilO
MNITDTKALHRLPKNIYLDYIKLFPITQTPEIKTYTTLIMTLIAIIGFSVFAISPTLNTIVELRKTRADNRFAETSLENKISAMQSLQNQYTNMDDTLERISAAIPTGPDVPTLIAKIQTLAQKSNISVIKMESQEVELTKKSTGPKPSSFVINMTVSGSYPQVDSFLESLHTFDRILTIDSITINRDEQTSSLLVTTIRARAYFHPEATDLGGVTSSL